MKTVFQFSLTALLVCLLSSSTFSQKVNGELNLSIAVDNTNFYQTQSAKVHVRIKWGPVAGARVDALRAVSFQLTESGMNANDCARGDCFGATYRLPNRPLFRHGESIEIDTDLNELYWNDLISSLYGFMEPKNMAEAIHPGSYVLSMSVGFPAEHSTRKKPRVVLIRSNFISIQVK